MSGARVRGRPAERSDWGCPERVWPAVRAPWRLGARYWHRASAQETHDQLFNGLPASSETERGASSPERRGAEASPLRSGHRGRALWTCSDATAVPASSGQKAGRHRCRAAQSPFGSAGPPAALPIPRQRHRVSSRLCPLLPGHVATAAAPAPIADAAAPFDPLLTRLLPPMGDPPPGLFRAPECCWPECWQRQRRSKMKA